jgi:hypothetical protein
MDTRTGEIETREIETHGEMSIALATEEELAADWSATGEANARLLAENEQLVARLRRLGPALADMAQDLAQARRENVLLKREVSRLRSLTGAAAD